MSVSLMALISFSIFITLYAPWEKPLFENSDFQRGNLYNWFPEGDTFLNQPTYGDNPFCRGRTTADVYMKYWIGTYENRHTKDDPCGKAQGDGPTGVLKSVSFVIERDNIGFMIGAGDNTRNESVALEIEGQEVLLQKGWGSTIDSEKMSRVVWDVSRWKGKKARIVIRDNSSGPWGHINVADFRYL